jgi:heat shock protein HslJ
MGSKAGHFYAALVILLLVPRTVYPEALAGSEWQPVCIPGEVLPAKASAFIQFRSAGRLLGNTGCNRLMGEYRVDGEQIHIGGLSSTRKACGADVMQQEQALIQALGKAHTFQRARTRLFLFDDDGLAIFELRQTDWD